MHVRALLRLAVTLALATGLISGPAASAPQPPTPARSSAEGVFLVRYRHDLPASAIEALNRQTGAQTLRVISGIGVHKLSVPSGRTVAEMVSLYRSLTDIAFAEPDYFAEVQDTVPNDAFFPQQWGPAKVKLPAAWDLARGSGGVIVAVVDTGVDWTHPDLQGRFVPGYDFVGNTTVTQDDHGHGTHVAGIAGALTNNTTGVAGANWQVTMLPVKVLDRNGSGTHSAVASGIVYAADQGAKVINLSLGGSDSSETLRAAVEYAWGKGAFLACAAGNTNGRILYPAAYLRCTAIGATDQNDQKASFSSHGPGLALTAPGVSVLSTVPVGACALCDASGYTLLSGTSMATPHVAGLAALLFAHFPAASNADVRNQMAAQVDDLGTPGWDPYFGYGRINAYKALVNPLSPPVPPLPPAPQPLSARISNPTNGSTVTGSVAIEIVISGGNPPYRVIVLTQGRNRDRKICDFTTSTTPATCNWASSKGAAGVYEISAFVYDATTSIRDSVTVTAVK